MEKMFLWQTQYPDYVSVTLITENNLIHRLDMNDIYQDEFDIWYVAEFGKVTHCTYKGWQPNCLIEVVRDDTGEVIVRGYGKDH